MPEMRPQREEHVTETYETSTKRRQQTPDKGRYANGQPHAMYSSHLSLKIYFTSNDLRRKAAEAPLRLLGEEVLVEAKRKMQRTEDTGKGREEDIYITRERGPQFFLSICNQSVPRHKA